LGYSSYHNHDKTMSEPKHNSAIKLNYNNWYLWDCYIKSTIHQKNAYVAFDPEPIDLRMVQQIIPATATSATTTPTIVVIPQPSADELKTYCEELKEWKMVNNVTAGVILGAISDDVQHIINLEEPAKDMYNKLKAKIVKQSSGSCANGTHIKLVYKQFKDTPTIENFEKHLMFYHSKNASLIAVSAGFNDSFLTWLLLNSFSKNEDPTWSMASTNIVTSDVPINKWSFNQVAGKLQEALQNNLHPTAEAPAQAALNATTGKMTLNCYSRPPCMYPSCRAPKTHPTDKCWIKERESKEKGKDKKYRAKRAKKKVIKSSSKPESGSDSLDSDLEWGQKKHHHANRSQAHSHKTLQVLKATINHA